MQIDFHHGVTYILARLAGFSQDEANVVAYSAQYVDDATMGREVFFRTGEMYSRIPSAHKMLDYRNFDALQDSRVWIPFHFLPGNCGIDRGGENHASLEEKLVCLPNSFVAQEMFAEAIRERNRPHGLHRLGITMHVYADTWAHQGFLGRKSQMNRVLRIEREDGSPDDPMNKRLKAFFADAFDEAKRSFVSDVSPLGHGGVLSYPDQPYLNWRYTNFKGDPVIRKNSLDFDEAAETLYLALCRYRLGDPNANVDPMRIEDADVITELIRGARDDSGEARHAKWIAAVKEGRFSFGEEELRYDATGPRSWEEQALGASELPNEPRQQFEFRNEFIGSNWRRFYNALQAHRLFVLSELLPSFGICVV